MRLSPSYRQVELSMTLDDETNVRIYFYGGVPVIFTAYTQQDFMGFFINQPYNNRTFAKCYIGRTLSKLKSLFLEIEVKPLTKVVFNKELHHLIGEYSRLYNKSNWSKE